MKKLLVLIVLVSLSSITVAQKFTYMPDSTLTPKFNAIFQETFYHLLDSFRVSSGLNALTVDSTLEQVALKHSMYMDYEDELTHSELNTSNPYFTASRHCDGENCYSASKCLPSPELMAIRAFKVWLNSPGHRRNMSWASYTSVGVAIYDNYATTNFK